MPLFTGFGSLAEQPVVTVGGRADLEPTRHFRGTLAGTSLWPADLNPAAVACAYRGGQGGSSQPGAHTLAISPPPPLPQAWFGCLDPLATNYDPAARLGDSTACVYAPPCWQQQSRLGWTDMAAAAAVAGLSQDDDIALGVPLPFAFRFFGQVQWQV